MQRRLRIVQVSIRCVSLENLRPSIPPAIQVPAIIPDTRNLRTPP